MNTREVQALLHSFGWPIDVDGSFGPSTHAAVQEFQRGWTYHNLLIDGWAGPATEQAMELSKARDGRCSPNFRFRDFKSKGNGWVSCHRDLVRGLEKYRSRVGHGVGITSGYRDPAYNRKVGGKPNSQHLYGLAADVAKLELSPGEVAKLQVFSGIGIKHVNGKDVVLHMDVRHVEPETNTTHGTAKHPTIWYY